MKREITVCDLCGAQKKQTDRLWVVAAVKLEGDSTPGGRVKQFDVCGVCVGVKTIAELSKRVPRQGLGELVDRSFNNNGPGV